MRTTFKLLVAFACLAPLVAVAAPSPGVGNLGDSLLDDDWAKALSPAQEDDHPGAGWLPTGEQLDQLLREGAEEATGEDLGESPLASVVDGMRRAERLIGDDGKPATQAQREVVTQLDRLIAQMEKQCQGGACNKSGSQENKRQASKRSQPKEGEGDKPSESQQASNQPSKKATQANTSGATAIGGAPPTGVNQTPDELIKQAWGHLPERMREQMLQGSGGEFLPEYRDELQQYFRRLAERSSREAP